MSLSVVADRASSDAHYTFPDGPPLKPLLVTALDFASGPLRFITNVQRRYGMAATVPFRKDYRMVAFFSPSAVRTVLAEQPRKFLSREFNDVLLDVLGDGLLTIDGEKHRQQRRLVQPAFHKKRIESYADIMTAHTVEMLSTWRVGQVRDIATEMQRLTLRIVAKALFDVDLSRDSSQLGQAFTDVITFPNERRISWKTMLRIDSPLLPYGRYMRGRRVLDERVYQIIAERRASGRDSGDVLSMLLAAHDEDGTVMSDKQVRDHTMTFFGAGHETTANALAWTFYLLGCHPLAWAELRAEWRRVLNGRIPTVSDLPALRYTDMVIKESMRILPPVWTIGRTAAEDCEIDGYRLPAGQIIMLPQWVIHRLPAIWGEDALAFRPERFDPEHPQDVPQFAYYPFGGGPRICIGMPFAQMEARLLLATIGQRFTPMLVPGQRIVPDPHVTLRPKHGIKVSLAE
jgi:cytochrome P450